METLGLNIIYGLIDPLDGTLRYIGQSIHGLKRANSHHRPSQIKTSSIKNNWIRGLKSKNLIPTIEVLEYSNTPEELDSLERFWIANIRSTGAKLYNRADGGESGNRGLIRSQEVRDKLKGPRGPRTEEVKRNMAPNFFKVGHFVTDEVREKLRLANVGKVLSVECRRKIGEKSKLHRHSLETRIKMSLSQMGKKLSQEHIEKLRSINLGRTFSPEHIEKLKNAQSVAIRLLPSNDIIKSVKEAAEILKMHKGNLSAMLRGKRKWRGGTILAEYVNPIGVRNGKRRLLQTKEVILKDIHERSSSK